MLLDLRSLEEVVAVVVPIPPVHPDSVGGSLGQVVWDSTWQRIPRYDKIAVDNRAAILALYAAGALTEDEFVALFAAT